MSIEKYTQAFGVAGAEEQVRKVIIEDIKDYVDELLEDSLGNLIALKRGIGKEKKKVMLAAHMDEIGLQVIHITEKGFLKIRNIGGVRWHAAYMQSVIFENGVKGIVLCSDNIDKVPQADAVNKMYIDIGAANKEEALEMVSIGDYACFEGGYIELGGGLFSAKALDDRLGCYVIAEALKKLEKPYHDVYFVFTIQEEVGLRGAKISAERINPDLGIAVDVTLSFDVPGGKTGSAVLNGGAAIKVSDSAVLCDAGVVKAMVACAEENGIKYQLDALMAGGTDAGAISLSNQGVKSGGVSVPIRYVHTPRETGSFEDTNAAINLLHKFLEKNIEIVTEIKHV